jgi:gamma-glutamyltranspeptidase/glutathione hydrolase
MVEKRKAILITVSLSLALTAYSIVFAKPDSLFKKGIVVSKNPEASKVGAYILSKGGNAVDAAVATGYAIGAIEPSGSGLGGGGFALIYMADTKEIKSIDFRVRAPQNINKGKEKIDFRNGPTASGTPGELAGYEYLRQKYGNLSRKEILEPVIALAKKGAPVTKKLHNGILDRRQYIEKYNSNSEIFLPSGKVPEVGYILKRPELAKTLELISQKGAEEFYRGNLAKKIASDIQKAGGILTIKDLNNYKVYEVKPVCGTYRGEKKICSFPPPSSGGVAIIEALNILENFDMPKYDYKSPERLHYLIESLKFSFRDRALSLGDPRFNKINTEKITSKEYAKSIADLIKNTQKAVSSDKINLGNEKFETTHFTVVDKWGNIAALTVSLNGSFGSAFEIPKTGIIMNNTLDDFSQEDFRPNQFGLIGNNLNSPEPYKTPLSSMSPTIVFDKNNQPVLALGSPGGPTIISGVLNTLLAFLDQKMPLKDAVSAGRVHHQWMPDVVYSEKSLIDEKTQKILEKQYGYKFPQDNNNLWSKAYWYVQAVQLDSAQKTLTGASDPRSEQGMCFQDN